MGKETYTTQIIDLAEYLHQAVLDPHINKEDLNAIFDASNYLNFSGLCTNLVRIPLARKSLGKSQKTKLIAVIGFPFGDIPHNFKHEQAEWAAEQGADELDVVPNFLELYKGNIDLLAEELSKICEIGLPTRAIINAPRLNDVNLRLIVEACIDAGVQGIQTSNGFGPKITPEKVKEIVPIVKGRCSIKAVGGIKNLLDALDLIQAGCSVIGTSVGPELIKEFRKKNK
tara:strand:+ start:172 stop:855 length:684 start_codon:yes stop_codon:yes gene_type:complete